MSGDRRPLRPPYRHKKDCCSSPAAIGVSGLPGPLDFDAEASEAQPGLSDCESGLPAPPRLDARTPTGRWQLRSRDEPTRRRGPRRRSLPRVERPLPGGRPGGQRRRRRRGRFALPTRNINLTIRLAGPAAKGYRRVIAAGDVAGRPGRWPQPGRQDADWTLAWSCPPVVLDPLAGGPGLPGLPGSPPPKGTVGRVLRMGVVNPRKSQYSIFQNCEIPRGEI